MFDFWKNILIKKEKLLGLKCEESQIWGSHSHLETKIWLWNDERIILIYKIEETIISGTVLCWKIFVGQIIKVFHEQFVAYDVDYSY